MDKFLVVPDAVAKHSGLLRRSLYGGIRSDALGDGLGFGYLEERSAIWRTAGWSNIRLFMHGRTIVVKETIAWLGWIPPGRPVHR